MHPIYTFVILKYIIVNPPKSMIIKIVIMFKNRIFYVSALFFEFDVVWKSGEWGGRNLKPF